MTTAWDPSFWNSQMTIDPDGLTVTAVSGFSVCGLALDKLTGNTFYCLYIITHAGASDGQLGIGVASRTVNRSNFLGADTQGIGAWPGDTAIWINGNRTLAMPFSTTDGITVGVAIKPSTKEIWATIDGVTWNAGGTANPVTGVGGASFSSITGDLYPSVSLTIPGAKAKGLFAAADWPAGWKPAGYNEINAPVPIGATATTALSMGETATGKLALSGTTTSSLVFDGPATASLPVKGSSTSVVTFSQSVNGSSSETLSGNADQALTTSVVITGNLLIQGKVATAKSGPSGNPIIGQLQQNLISTVHNNYNGSADQTLSVDQSSQADLFIKATSSTSIRLDQTATSRQLTQASADTALSVSQVVSGALGERPASVISTLRMTQALYATIRDTNPWIYDGSVPNSWNID